MKNKLLKFALAAFLAFLPLPFIADSSYVFAGMYVVIATMICGATWGQLNRGKTNENP
jgi:hypothetical protein